MLRPVIGWETNHSQMTTGFFMLRPMKGWETKHSQMTTSFFMIQSWMLDSRRRTTEDRRRMAEKRRISNIEQGILNDEVRRAPGRETEKPVPGVNSRTGDRISELVD